MRLSQRFISLPIHELHFVITILVLLTMFGVSSIHRCTADARQMIKVLKKVRILAGKARSITLEQARTHWDLILRFFQLGL